MPFNSKSASKAGKKSSRKGVPNKATKKAKTFLIEFLEDDQPTAIEDWTNLDPRERWNIRTKLYDYVTPKMSRTDMHIDVSKLSDEEVNELLTRALEMAENNPEDE